MFKSFFSFTYKIARRVVVAVVGSTIVLFGVILIFIPGPAFVVIPIGIGVLGIEFAWARRLLYRARDESVKAMHHFKWFRRRRPGSKGR
jgi:tellurite resistance protein TerC